MLYDELAKRHTNPQRDEGYVFPEQARMYLENPDGITWRVKKILAVRLGEAVDDGDGTRALLEIPNEELGSAARLLSPNCRKARNGSAWRLCSSFTSKGKTSRR